MAEFAELRAQISIERVFTDMLGVTDFQKSGTRQLLGTCPSCGSRALKVTPSMGMSNCFGKSCAMRGDIIKVVALAKKLSLADAGNAIAAHFGLGSSRPIRSGAPATSAGTFDPIEYQKKLDPENVALLPLGIASGIIREFGGGYIGKGKLGVRLALPITMPVTANTSFFGVPLGDEGEIKFANDEDRLAIFNTGRIEEGEPLTVCRDPLAVLRAAENGDTQVVAIFTGYTPDALRRVASLMESKKIETAELL